MPTEPAREAAILAPTFRASGGLKFRLRGLAVALPLLAVLGVASSLHPEARGLGTHEQLGLGQCSFLTATGWPCPTCGMTTSFAATMHGQLGLAFRAQPIGPILVAGVLAMLAMASAELTTGRSFFGLLRPRWWWLTLGIVALAAAWALKAGMGLAEGRFPVH
jgi:hypothetical protein